MIRFGRAYPLILLFLLAAAESGGTARVYPAPPGEALSKGFTVKVEGKDCPVYLAKVAPRDPERRWKAMDDKKNSADYYETASFATFDMQGTVRVTVTCPEPIRTARILPTSAGIVPSIEGQILTLMLREPRPLTVEVNGHWCSSLHLFANPFEANVPQPGDANVIYLGPGIHEVSRLVVGDNQTVYIAGGAVDGADYYLANKLGSGAGTKDAPFGLVDLPKPDNKPTTPLMVLQPGDALYFRGGEYAFHTGPVKDFYYVGYLCPVRSGEPDRPISFRACPGEKVAQDAASGHQPIFGNRDRDYVRHEGFVIKGSIGHVGGKGPVLYLKAQSK